VRARLEKMLSEDTFTCLCDPQMAARMDRVVNLAGGAINTREEQGGLVRLTIAKL